VVAVPLEVIHCINEGIQAKRQQLDIVAMADAQPWEVDVQT
jgi:hypothetical protein